MSKFITEFNEFAMRGNVLDMAVGVVIGAAFGKIVSSLVDDLIMPEVTLNWGTWVQTVVNFIIIAFCIFVMIKFVNKLSRKKAEEPAPAESEPTKEEVLLTEIRDLLKDRKPE